MSAPKDLLSFYNQLIKEADSFGFDNTKYPNGRLRETILDKADRTKIKTTDDNEKNFWFGFIRPEQPDGGPYEGLSFVVFPESTGTHCVVSIGIGSSTTAEYRSGSLGPDMELATKHSFVRSFRSLTKVGHSDAQFFFKLDFSEMIAPTPGLKDALESLSSPTYDPAMINTVAVYDHEEKGGLLPASMLVDYSTDDGYRLIVSWLAQYAKWRNWSSYNKGTVKPGKAMAIESAINVCKKEKESLEPDDIYKILIQKRFIVLQGAPGCGKTWTANKVSERKEFFETKFIQFHAETSYADFIYGIKPVLDGETLAYNGYKGALLEILDNALKKENKDKKFLLIIDEINRANLANVLGPVFYLFEQTADNRTHKLNLGLDKEGKPIEYDHIPDNLYVIATMNTADKSLAVVDFALRRRFSWVTLRPHKPDLKKLPGYIFDDELFNKIDNLFDEFATDEELNLQPGQSYFIYKDDKSRDLSRKDTIRFGLMPLIKEYINESYLTEAKDAFAQLFYSYGSDLIMYE
jgi:hypothetical protein